MKVNIGPYPNWFGPYQLAEKLCFWAKPVEDEHGIERKPKWVHNFGEWLAHGKMLKEPEEGEVQDWSKEEEYTLLYKFLSWIDKKKKRKVEIHIDKYDTWNLDRTLGMIALPMLRQLKETNHGYGMVDLEDVPENLRYVEREHYSQQLDLFDQEVCNPENISIAEERWNWVMNEIIFAFEHHLDDSWEEEYKSGEHHIMWKKKGNLYEMVNGPNDTYKCDYEGIQKVRDRIQNGFRLFGKYYGNLWD